MCAMLSSVLGGESHWHPKGNCPIAETEARGHHTYKGVAIAVKRDRLAQYVWISTKSSLPKTMTENDYLIVTDLIFSREKVSADARLCAQHRKKTIGNPHSLQSFRIACADHIERHSLKG